MFEFLFKYPRAVFSKGDFVLLGAWPTWVLVILLVAAAAGWGRARPWGVEATGPWGGKARPRVVGRADPPPQRHTPPAPVGGLCPGAPAAPGAGRVAVLRGGGRAEVRFILPPMAEAARILARDRGLVPVIALAPTLRADELAEQAKTDLGGVRIIEGDTYSIIAASEAALVASGTATRETALLGCPMVIAYKASPLTYRLGRMLVTGVKFIGMPNILAGEQIVPELIQDDFTSTAVAAEVRRLLDSPKARAQMKAGLAEVRARLGGGGAIERAADVFAQML